METRLLEVFRTVARLGSITAGCVAAGLGVALVPALAIRGTPADIALLRIHPDDEPVRAVNAVTPAGRTRPATVDHFLTHLAEQAARR